MEKSIAVVIGRFEPLHKGHERLISIALSKSDTCLIFVIDSYNCKIPIKLRLKFIEELYKDKIENGKVILKAFKPLERVNHEYGRNIIDNVEKITGKKPQYIVYGSDKKVENCFSKEYTSKINFIKVDRNKLNISGTNLRKAIKNNDKYYIKYSLNKKLFKYINKMSTFY